MKRLNQSSALRSRPSSLSLLLLRKHPSFLTFCLLSTTVLSNLTISPIAFATPSLKELPNVTPTPQKQIQQKIQPPLRNQPIAIALPEQIQLSPEQSQTVPKSLQTTSDLSRIPQGSAKDLLPISTVAQMPAIDPAVQPAAVNPQPPLAKLESITTDFRNDTDRNGLLNRIIEPTAQFKLRNGDKLRVTTGVNTFEQPGVESITNIPLKLGWEHKIGDATLKAGGGVDLFNRLPAAPSLNTGIELPIGLKKDETGKLIGGAIVSGLVDYGPYKANARTLQNQINVTHIKPSVYWQIDRNTSLYAQYQLGLYNDGNTEHQVFSRLERKFGEFFVAANLFAWNYNFDAEQRSGYFSPQDFLTYNGEIGWEGSVFNALKCRVSANLGEQRLRSQMSTATNYQARCTVPISPNLEADIGYQINNSQNRITSSTSTGNSLTGQLRWKF